MPFKTGFTPDITVHYKYSGIDRSHSFWIVLAQNISPLCMCSASRLNLKGASSTGRSPGGSGRIHWFACRLCSKPEEGRFLRRLPNPDTTPTSGSGDRPGAGGPGRRTTGGGGTRGPAPGTVAAAGPLVSPPRAGGCGRWGGLLSAPSRPVSHSEKKVSSHSPCQESGINKF